MSNLSGDQQKQSGNSCRMCKCSETGQVYCFTKSCIHARYPSYARLSISLSDEIQPSRPRSSEIKEINARTIPFLADFIKTMRKDSIVFVAAGPKLTASTLFLVDQKKQQTVSQFTVRDLALSRVFYQYQPEYIEGAVLKPDDDDDENEDSWSLPKTDFVQLMFVSADNQTVHSVLIEFEIGANGLVTPSFNTNKNSKVKNDQSLLSRSVKGLNAPSVQQSKRVSA